MWIKFASNIYSVLFYFDNFVIFTKYFKILQIFYLLPRSFIHILYMDFQRWKDILN